MPSKRRNIRVDRKGVSPAISMVVITAATVVLVLIAGNFALQVLEHQRGATEFDTVQKSLITFDDALRDIAFDRGGSRSVHFTCDYGSFRLLPNNEYLNVAATGGGISYQSPQIPMGVVRYTIPTNYVTFGNGYSNYALGDSSVVVSSATDSFGRMLISQQSNNVTQTLDYRPRVTREGPSTLINGEKVNYVDILLVRMNISKPLTVISNFDLVARNLNIQTISSPAYTVTGSQCTVSVKLGDQPAEPISLYLDAGKVVFNLIIADVEVTI
jgi:hypothetical protein